MDRRYFAFHSCVGSSVEAVLSNDSVWCIVSYNEAIQGMKDGRKLTYCAILQYSDFRNSMYSILCSDLFLILKL